MGLVPQMPIPCILKNRSFLQKKESNVQVNRMSGMPSGLLTEVEKHCRNTKHNSSNRKILAFGAL